MDQKLMGWKRNNKPMNKNEMYPCINRNSRPNNNQLITYFQHVHYFLRILQYFKVTWLWQSVLFLVNENECVES